MLLFSCSSSEVMESGKETCASRRGNQKTDRHKDVSDYKIERNAISLPNRSQHPATAAAAAEPTEDHLLSFLLNSADPVSEHSTEDVQDSSQRCGSNNSQHSSNGQCNSSPPSSEHVTFRASGAARAVHVLVTTDVLPSMDELMQQLQGGGTALTTMMLGSKVRCW